MPILLEEEEIHTLETLDSQGRWDELADYEKELRSGDDDLKELRVEADNIQELKFVLQAIDTRHQFIIDFEKMLIIIDDSGRDS